MKPYMIHTFPWYDGSAGEKVLHMLAKALWERFPNDTFVLADKQGKLNIPTVSQCSAPRVDCIGIYPEVTHGNPLECGTIVRYLLNVPGVFGGPASYLPTDVLFIYHQFFNNKVGLPENRILTTPYVDTKVFYNMGLERAGRLYYQGHGRVYGSLNVPNIGNGWKHNGEEGQKALAVTLNKCELLYSFDSITAMYEIARLCGCPVIIMPNAQWSKEECKAIQTWDAGGIGYGLEDEAYVLATIDSEKMKASVEAGERVFQGQLDNFIQITQEAAG